MAERFMTDKRIAAGYGTDRPFLHGRVLDMALADLHAGKTFRKGLDVGCGAGLSVWALLPFCGSVTGTDISADMIVAAGELHGGADCRFLRCDAQELDRLEEVYDIVTVAGVADWIDTGRFLAGLAKVVRDGSILLIYDFWITDRMEGSQAYTRWWHDRYLQKFPRSAVSAARTDEDTAAYGFWLQEQKRFELSCPFRKEAFVRFLMLQSNLNAYIRESAERTEEAGRWLEETLSPVFGGEEKILLFDGYYRRYVYRGSKKDS